MSFGQAIVATPVRTAPATIQTLGPRQAMAETLAEYLRSARFRVWGNTAASEDFALKAVFAEWPDSSKELPYPCASVIERTDTFYEGHNLVPTPLEDTLGVHDCLVMPPSGVPSTVLWKTAEASVEFQVDFWANSVAVRESIEAELGHLFNPGQERSGVLLEGPERYYSRRVRATLLSHGRPDNAGAVYSNERRLQTIVRCEVDVVHLRMATLLSPTATTTVEDPSDPQEN